MCEPTTIALIATTVVAAGYGAYTQKQSANYQEAAAKESVKIAEGAAKDAEERGRSEAATYRERVARMNATAKTGFAASGVEIDSGSALDTLVGNYAIGETDALMIESNAAREAYGYRVQGRNFGAEANLARYSGRAGATATLLGGAASAFGQYGGYKASGGKTYFGNQPGRG